MRRTDFVATLAATVLLAMAGAAHAQVQVLPTSYDMLNGESGSFTYWDETYNGSGNTALNLAPLSGGVGDLTNGVMPAQNWNVEETTANGPYVGWQTINPIITFNFAGPQQIQQVRIHADDSGGNGGVFSPSSVNINGTNFTFAPQDPAGTAPFLATFDVSSLNLNTNQVQVEIFRGQGWIMVSEVQFFVASSVAAPEPGSLTFLALGGISLVASRRLRRK